ncbi:hypothetical protein GGX14DRAFT_586597 [Mycena pura]|uniref:Uncharacterized protein n=1 Tax=Mycena pura TaxID=153505 RepID=A0AAD6YGJ0_9AGAR|nr:hypothetical protein GGX14DRAFT_586597 [Mycena pura]
MYKALVKLWFFVRHDKVAASTSRLAEVGRGGKPHGACKLVSRACLIWPYGSLKEADLLVMRPCPNATCCYPATLAPAPPYRYRRGRAHGNKAALLLRSPTDKWPLSRLVMSKVRFNLWFKLELDRTGPQVQGPAICEPAASERRATWLLSSLSNRPANFICFFTASSIAARLAKRGRSCGVVDIQVQPLPEDEQPDWWIVANKRIASAIAAVITYSGPYSIIGGTPDAEDEVDPHTVENVRRVFTGRKPVEELGDKDENNDDSAEGLDSTTVDTLSDPDTAEDMDRPEERQDGVLLFFLGITLMSLCKREEWMKDWFDEHGRDPYSDSGDSCPVNDDDANGRGLNFQRRWSGELATARGFSVEVIEGLSHNDRNSVYSGILLQNGALISPVAVKHTNLRDDMEECISKCYGLCVSSGGSAFLVTGLVQELENDRPLTLADRNANYAALDKMHRSGWCHNDIIGHTTVRNVLWSHTGRPVLIDLESATKHVCNKECRELREVRSILRLSRRGDASRKGSKRKRPRELPGAP